MSDNKCDCDCESDGCGCATLVILGALAYVSTAILEKLDLIITMLEKIPIQ